MINAIVGHRGVGKTSFLARVKFYYQERMQTCHTFDLDREIEKQSEKNISEIFLSLGENEFRKLEIQMFNQILNNARLLVGPIYIALGAGFSGDLSQNINVIWLRRETDRLGRIFLDRPRLESDMTPLAEFMHRFDEREKKFKKIFHKEIILGEGWTFTNPYEPILLDLKPSDMGTSVTLWPDYLTNKKRLDLFLTGCSLQGVRYLELRDDLLSEDQIRLAADLIPKEKVLISFRNKTRTKSFIDFSYSYATDWAIELGECPLLHTTFSSLHERLDGESIEEASLRLLNTNADHYKFSPLVNSFIELWSGHRFYSENPEQKSFLPRSKAGRWAWYRLLQNKKMKLNFMRTGESPYLDQPTPFDFLRFPQNSVAFAAILGDPVQQSHTPAEQHDFFYSRKIGVVAIPMNENECDSLNMSVLDRLGLNAAAVTAPLKNKMKNLCSHVDLKTEELGAVNTIVSTQFGWSGTNTDVAGVKSIFASLVMPNEVVVWGGGGTRLVLRDVLPHAHFFSARRGEEIWVEKQTPLQPEIVVWAVGRNRINTTQPPPQNWQPQYVVDLNYTENSPGLEYAMRTGAKYISGKALFKSQAQGQRDFWMQNLQPQLQKLIRVQNPTV